ncbi:MAG: septum formation initiator family protein [Bacteroidales bacterium]|nr:septum formation initiator family protein [Bacteroidales bacterium]
MKALPQILKSILPALKNKYVLTFLIFLIWLIFFDQNNLVDRVRQMNRHEELQEEKKFYQQKIKKDSVKLHQLKTNEENLEEFAREEYYMKKENEDIYIIVEE